MTSTAPDNIAEFFIDLMDVEAYINKTERKETSAWKMFNKFGYFNANNKAKISCKSCGG